MRWLFIRHPEPVKERRRILPVFMPFHGCPERCIYCAQSLQTGAGTPNLPEILQNLALDLEKRDACGQAGYGLAFFGGTFTALPASWQDRFLDLARQYKDTGLITHVRCSTRPDRITPDGLSRLKFQCLDMVELGIQSFDTNVLRQSGRGYCGSLAHKSCEMVREAGLELAVQLMPGLPGSSIRDWQDDVRQTCSLQPAAVRLYPCVVLQGTPLAEAWLRGEFRPWEPERTILALGQTLLQFWKREIPVIRIGLAPEQDLLAAIMTGPWHPALGQMARSHALHAHLLDAMGPRPEAGSGGRLMIVPRRHAADFWGHRKSLACTWEREGFEPNRVRIWDRPFFCVRLPE